MQLRPVEKLAHSRRRNRRPQVCDGSAENFADANNVVLCHAASKTPQPVSFSKRQQEIIARHNSFISAFFSRSLLSFLIEKTSTKLTIPVVHCVPF
jgi:hypothetical protein